jgi:putative MFS transporter
MGTDVPRDSRTAAGSADIYAGQLIRSLDDSRFTKRHWALYLISCLGHVFDGYDVQMIGVVLPAIAITFALKPSAEGLLGSAAAFGMFFGAVAVGFVTDRIGRRSSLILALCTFALFSLLAAVSPNYGWLFVTRLLTGLGLGAEVVTMYAYIAEFLPSRIRGTLVTTSSFFWQMSAVGAALLAIAVVPALGWRAMFLIGTAPALVGLLVWRLLPESVRFLLERGRADDAARMVQSLSSIDPASVPEDDVTRTAGQVAWRQSKGSHRELLQGRYRRLTIGIWVIQFFNGFVLFAIGSWLPSILVAKGFTFVHSLQYTAVIVSVGALGNVGEGLLLDRIGRRASMLAFFVAGGILLMLWGAQSTASGILILGSLASFFIYGVSGAVYTYSSELYPTEHRGTGTGWSGAAQRVGAIVAPTVVGIMIGSKLPISSVFVLLAVGFLVAAVAVLTATYETKQQSLEQITAGIARLPSRAVGR